MIASQQGYKAVQTTGLGLMGNNSEGVGMTTPEPPMNL